MEVLSFSGSHSDLEANDTVMDDKVHFKGLVGKKPYSTMITQASKWFEPKS